VGREEGEDRINKKRVNEDEGEGKREEHPRFSPTPPV
jgi:hypothetical protein